MVRKPQHTLGAAASAGLCFVAVVLLYHIPLGDSVAADTLHACLAGLAALGCWRIWDGKDGRTAAGTRPAFALALLCLAASAASVAVPLVTSGDACHGTYATSMPDGIVALGVVALSCVGTAVWEEIAFRRLAMEAVASSLATPGPRRLQAALICAAVFALLHVGGTDDATTGALRAVQVVLFGLAMAGLVERTGKLVPAVITHALYDMVCFAPAALGATGSVWDMPAEALSILETSATGIAASLAFLVPAALIGVLAFTRQRPRP